MAGSTQHVSDADPNGLPDLASRRLGGSVVAANDELFAERENLVKPEAPAFSSYTFGHKGQIMDGWETRRRREPGHDWAIVRLGIPGIVRGVGAAGAAVPGEGRQPQRLPRRRLTVGHARAAVPVPRRRRGAAAGVR